MYYCFFYLYLNRCRCATFLVFVNMDSILSFKQASLGSDWANLLKNEVLDLDGFRTSLCNLSDSFCKKFHLGGCEVDGVYTFLFDQTWTRIFK